jgi:Flp pilus assembly protein TadD
LFVKGAQLSKQGQPLIKANRAYTAAGQAAQGEKALQQWVKEHDKDVGVRHELAAILLKNNRLQDAAEHYRFLVRLNPADLLATNNLAWILGELKSPDALTVAEQAYKLAPKTPAVMDTYGWQLAVSGQAKRGVPVLREAVAIVPDNPDIRWHLASALEKAGDKSAAIAELDRLLTSRIAFPQEAQARALLAQLRK